jgi:hypothetical protein
LVEAYDLHSYLPEKAAALQRWADELAGIVGEREDNIVVMTTRR